MPVNVEAQPVRSNRSARVRFCPAIILFTVVFTNGILVESGLKSLKNDVESFSNCAAFLIWSIGMRMSAEIVGRGKT